MDYLTPLLLLISFVSAIFLLFIFNHGSQSTKPSKLPPGPHPYPIIGNILELLDNNPLQAFTKLSKTYGPIMTLKLGSVTTIVISSPEIAKEALHKNDIILSSRTIPATLWSSLEDHCKISVIWLPTSTKWRTLRRACATKIFSPQQLDSTQFHRKRKVQDLLDYLHEYCKKGEALDIGEAIFVTVLNSISNTFLSMDLVHYNASSEKFQEFKEIIVGLTEESARPNLADFFSFFRLFDSQGVRTRTKNRYEKLYTLFDSAMEERMHLGDSKMNSRECNDVLDSLMDLVNEESSELSRHDVLHLFLDLFVAGIDTTSSTLVWAMAELLHNPIKLLKVREELQQVFGKNGQVEESYISKLPYLNAVVKETLRLHPPAPFLVPHKSNDDVELAGFTMPKNAQILVNVWSIGRDSSVWINPSLFEPKRFLESEIDFKGKNFELIPFGAGRRICPGLPLASRAIHLVLASLLHHYNWKLADEMKPEDIDMSYSYGITLQKAQPLRVVPIKV